MRLLGVMTVLVAMLSAAGCDGSAGESTDSESATGKADDFGDGGDSCEPEYTCEVDAECASDWCYEGCCYIDPEPLPPEPAPEIISIGDECDNDDEELSCDIGVCDGSVCQICIEQSDCPYNNEYCEDNVCWAGCLTDENCDDGWSCDTEAGYCVEDE